MPTAADSNESHIFTSSDVDLMNKSAGYRKPFRVRLYSRF